MNFIDLILSKIHNFVKSYFLDILLVIIVILLCLLSFSIGFIMAKYQNKKPIKFEQTNETHSPAYRFIS
jgi:lipopolysaccharide/colanic/teichoic acid biosynthesis glycosyltransferase